MSGSVLFVVHCETMFEYLMSDSFHSRLAEEVYGGGYTRVIVLESGLIGDDNERLPYLFGSRIESEDWSWGYEPFMFEDDPEEAQYVIEGSAAHEWTWVPHFIRDNLEYWRGMEVYVAGGCDYACLEDWRCVLNHMDIEFDETGVVF